MGKLFVIFLSFFHAISVHAGESDVLLKNLKARIHELPGKKGALIKSFTNHTQSYIYDQALAIIAFSKGKKKEDARRLLMGLKSLQNKDGSLYFSYYLDGISPYPAEGDRRIAGAISWVALASIHFQKEFDSTEFKAFNERILSYLKREIVSFEVEGDNTRALRFSPSDLKESPFPETDVVALEHNLDAYAAFLHYGILNKTSEFKSEEEHLRRFVLKLWDSEHQHFWSGASIKSGRVSKSELYLDNQTWSLLALDETILKKISPVEALSLNCEVFRVNQEGISGFMDSRPSNRPSQHSFVWSEGSLGQILAMKKISRLQQKTIVCDKMAAEDFLKSIKKMTQKDGGVAYATASKNPDFTTASSVAGTAWLYFAEQEINPFEMN
jgi:hypothetical protein